MPADGPRPISFNDDGLRLSPGEYARLLVTLEQAGKAGAEGLLQAAELSCKSTGMPDQMICRTALVQLTALPRSNVFATAK